MWLVYDVLTEHSPILHINLSKWYRTHADTNANCIGSGELWLGPRTMCVSQLAHVQSCPTATAIVNNNICVVVGSILLSLCSFPSIRSQHNDLKAVPVCLYVYSYDVYDMRLRLSAISHVCSFMIICILWLSPSNEDNDDVLWIVCVCQPSICVNKFEEIKFKSRLVFFCTIRKSNIIRQSLFRSFVSIGPFVTVIALNINRANVSQVIPIKR